VAFPDFSSSKTRAAAISGMKRVKQGRRRGAVVVIIYFLAY
jgi:hypothetical protein